MKKFLILLSLFGLLTAPAYAAPETYRLDQEQSVVGFTFQFQNNPRNGRMPVKSADMRLDLNNVPNSQVNVVLDASGSRAGPNFITNTMKGASVLNTKTYPEIRFTSTRIQGNLRGAKITGDLTMRGVTRPVTLDAGLYRQQGTAKTDRSKLIVQLKGSVSRSAFGAGGFPNLVDDKIDLNIVAYIEK